MSSGTIISSGIWPACSPNLNPCDFFFWGCWEDKVYDGNPQVEEVKKTFVGKLQIFLHNSFKGSICWYEESVCRGTAFSTRPVIYEL
jgi:hypothetical protein